MFRLQQLTLWLGVPLSYFVLLPCLLFVYTTVKRQGYAGGSFASGTLVLSLIITNTGLMAPGADVLLATSLAMCGFYMALWYWGPARETDSEEAENTEVIEAKPFCSQRTHDFAVQSSDTDFAVDLLRAEKWQELADSLATLGNAERQGFYANFDYSKIVSHGSAQQNLARDEVAEDQEADNDFNSSATTNCLIKFTNAQPHNADAHLLYGHYQLCEAKRLGLTPGAIQNAESAGALANAFRHFRLALRLSPDNPEALCGLILAKGFTGLSDEHIEKSLQRLLSVDALHFHGLIAAACFLVTSTAGANRFVSIVERTAGENNVTSAFARIVAHVECMVGVNAKPLPHTNMIADLHAQLRVYHKESASLAQWQQDIGNNIVAYAFEKIGDDNERAVYLDKTRGLLSPYPWRRANASEAASSTRSS